jgi:hypothetical protein
MAISIHIFLNISRGNFSGPSQDTDDILAGILILAGPMIPYLICLLASRKVVNSALVLPVVVFVICNDAFTYVDVLIASTSSTAAIRLVVVPFLNLIIALPFGFLINWLLTQLGPLKTRPLVANQ